MSESDVETIAIVESVDLPYRSGERPDTPTPPGTNMAQQQISSPGVKWKTMIGCPNETTEDTWFLLTKKDCLSMLKNQVSLPQGPARRETDFLTALLL